ncbi:uncharacterized protein [Embiotoca jacksoni]|uniref:uncharacterized protein isoform X2 n=1 Tax=Embiotoca jacksoni TaxID=100190 RepID=UPI003704A246
MAVWDIVVFWSFMFFSAGAAVPSVNYPFTSTCAVTGSTVILRCTFTPLKQVIRVVWCKNHEICQGQTPSVYDSKSDSRSSRYRYLGDKRSNCTLEIREVWKDDDGTFRFRMEATDSSAHFTNKTGVMLEVVEEMKMEVNVSGGDRELRSGETVTLRCTSRCTFHQLQVTWLRDGHTLSQFGPTLQIGPLTAEDSGNYSCALKTNTETTSAPFSLQVKVDAADKEMDRALSLVVGLVIGVLLLAGITLTILFTIIIIRRRRAAADRQRAVGGDTEQKRSDETDSSVLQLAKRQADELQKTRQAEEDDSYISIQFRQKGQDRRDRPEEEEEAVVYSSVRG